MRSAMVTRHDLQKQEAQAKCFARLKTFLISTPATVKAILSAFFVTRRSGHYPLDQTQ